MKIKNTRGCPFSINVSYPNLKWPVPEFITIHICTFTGRKCPKSRWYNYRKCTIYRALVRKYLRVRPLVR